MKTDSIVERKTMGFSETREFMKMLEGKPQKFEWNGCSCGCDEIGYSEKYNQKYCKGCLKEID